MSLIKWPLYLNNEGVAYNGLTLRSCHFGLIRKISDPNHIVANGYTVLTTYWNSVAYTYDIHISM